MNTGGDARQRVVLGLAITCAVIAVLLGSVGLADASLWLDETFSVFDARRSIRKWCRLSSPAKAACFTATVIIIRFMKPALKWALPSLCIRAPKAHARPARR